MKTTKQKLIEARDLISNPDHWTKHYFATTESGRKVIVGDIAACKWCSIGALWKVSEYDSDDAQNVLSKFMNGSVTEFNDSRSHEEVINAYNKAIENCP